VFRCDLCCLGELVCKHAQKMLVSQLAFSNMERPTHRSHIMCEPVKQQRLIKRTYLEGLAILQTD